MLMKTIKCSATFCQWNKKGSMCSHPNAAPGIMNETMNPAEYCENYRKYAVKAKKLKRK